MAMEQKKQMLDTEQVVSRNRVQLNVQADAMISGSGRDAAETLMEDAVVSITTVTVQQGRMMVDGVVVCQAAYRQSGSDSIRAIEARSQLQHVFEDEAIMSGMNGCVHAAVTHVESGSINGRILFRVTVELTGIVSGITASEVIAQLDGVQGAELRIPEITSVRCGAEAEAHAVLTETLALPKELETRSTLMDFAAVCVEKTEKDLGGVRVSGHVNAEVMIAGSIPGRPVAMVKYPMPFSQLVEMPEWLSSNILAEAHVDSIRSSLSDGTEPGDMALRLECALVVRVRALQEENMKCIADVYGTGTMGLRASAKNLRHTSAIKSESASETYRGTVLIPSSMPMVGTVLASHARAAFIGVTEENGTGILEGILEIAVIYMPSDGERPVTVRDEMPFRIRRAEPLADDSEVRVSVTSCEASALMNDRLEIRCNLKIGIESRTEMTTEIAGEIKEEMAAPKRAGIVMVWPGANDTAWDIGRRYRIPVSSVNAEAGGIIQPGRALVLRV